MMKLVIASCYFAYVHKNWNANYICNTEICQITWRTAFIQDQHRLVYMMWRTGFLLHGRTLLCQKLPAEFEEKLVAFQQHVIGLHKTKEIIILIQTGNVDENPLYFVELSHYTGNDVREKSVVMKTSSNENASDRCIHHTGSISRQ